MASARCSVEGLKVDERCLSATLTMDRSGPRIDRKECKLEMTPDGISADDWERVHELALAVANTSDPDEEKHFRRKLLDFLRELRSRYGDLSSILATEADYIDDVRASESLFLQAFDLAKRTEDLRNQRYVALSLADLYASDLPNLSAGRLWLDVAKETIASTDGSDWEEYTRIEKSLRSLQRTP